MLIFLLPLFSSDFDDNMLCVALCCLFTMMMHACSKGRSGSSGGGGVPDAVPVAEAIHEAFPANESMPDPSNASNLRNLSLPKSVQVSNVNVFISGREVPGTGGHGDGCRIS